MLGENIRKPPKLSLWVNFLPGNEIFLLGYIGKKFRLKKRAWKI